MTEKIEINLNSPISKYVLIYFILISLFAVIITVADKRKAKKGRYRISEKCLILTGFFGGALSMYITMKAIRHKTKHKLFMVGLPIIIILHILIFVIIFLNI